MQLTKDGKVYDRVSIDCCAHIPQRFWVRTFFEVGEEVSQKLDGIGYLRDIEESDIPFLANAIPVKET